MLSAPGALGRTALFTQQHLLNPMRTLSHVDLFPGETSSMHLPVTGNGPSVCSEPRSSRPGHISITRRVCSHTECWAPPLGLLSL